MKYRNIVKNIVLIGGLFFSFIGTIYANNFFDVWKLPFCNNEGECWYRQWLEAIKNSINGMIINKTLSEYIQDVIAYLLSFISIIAVIYIIYAWFRIMIAWWNDDEIKKWKKTIIQVIIWIIIIWLAYSIVTFVINVLWVTH